MGALEPDSRQRNSRTARRATKFLRYLRVLRKRRRALVCTVLGATILCIAAAATILNFLSADTNGFLSPLFPSPRQDADLHIALIIDPEQNLSFTASTVRSLLYHASRRPILHIVASADAHESLRRIVATDADLYLYNFDICKTTASQVWFIAQRASLSELCALFLADILPPLPSVLYVDSRSATAVADVAPCARAADSASPDTLIALAPDLSDTCAAHPHFCYPLAFDWQLPSGLVCGTTPSRAARLNLSAASPNCRGPGEREPLPLHPGVAVMRLSRMRELRFTDRLVQASVLTWRSLNYRAAARGASDLLNNYLRLFPEAAADLPCGCNYQFTASRRLARCPGRAVRVARADPNVELARASHDPYVHHFNFWRDTPIIDARVRQPPPAVPALSERDSQWTPPTPPRSAPTAAGPNPDYMAARRSHTPDCAHQAYLCAATDRDSALVLPLDILRDRVYVLTRTSGRPRFFSHMAASVAAQTHPYVTHVVGTDDDESMNSYLSGVSTVRFATPEKPFDSGEVCRRCRTPDGTCAKAPPLTKPKARQAFFDCYCATSYPMNTYVNELHARVRNGWVLYVDDDNLLASRFALSELVAAASSRDELLAFRSHLGRATPTEPNFRNRVIVMGDFDASNFAVHSKHIDKATWPALRCGDFRTAARLAALLPTRWVDRTFIHANPLRAALGGLGARADIAPPPVTVIVTSHVAAGWRPGWVQQIIEAYTSAEMHDLISRVILVWNGGADTPPPRSLIASHSARELQRTGKLVVVRPAVNSLNARWTATIPHITTDAVLNLDDDVYVTRPAIVCLLSWLRREPSRMVGPYVRRIAAGGRYVLDELLDSSAYSVTLPRVLLLPVDYLQRYATSPSASRRYVDTQAAHCDDILLNVLALNASSKPPLRALLPEGSVIDFYDKCWPLNKSLTGGLGLQPKRAAKRSECVAEIMHMHKLSKFKSAAHVATCLPRGNALAKVPYIPPSGYTAMKNRRVQCAVAAN